jgi:hypothetical protein
MKDIRIILPNIGELDLATEANIPLNWNINDVREIRNRGGVFSKTIKLAGSNNNNALLQDLFNVNRENLTFNPRRKEKMNIVVDGSVILSGIIQITKVRKIYREGTVMVEYDAAVRNDPSDLFSVLDGRFINELDLSMYSHRLTEDLVTRSMRQGNYTDGYQYWLGWNEPGEWQGQLYQTYEPRDLKPAVYVKAILDQMMTEAEYTYDFPQLYDINFDKLVIPFSGDVLRGSLQQQPFIAGQDNFVNYKTSMWPMIDFKLPVVPVYLDTPVEFDRTTPPFSNPDGSWVLDTYNLSNDVTAMTFESRFTIEPWVKATLNVPGHGSAVVLMDNEFTTGQGFIQLREPETIIIQTFPILIEDFYPGNNPGVVITRTSRISLVATDANDNVLGPPLAENVYTQLFTMETRLDRLNENIYDTPLLVDLTGTFTRSFYPSATKVKVVISDDYTVEGNGVPQFIGFKWNGKGRVQPSDIFIDVGRLYPSMEFGMDVFQTTPRGFIRNIPDPDLYDGSLVNLANVLPANIKQSEFLLGLTRLFNLYIYDDNEIEKKVVIKTRDKFYEDGNELDWTDKVDKTSIDLNILSNTQNKIVKMTYTEDGNDVALEAYSNRTNRQYGELDYIFDNDFTRGESEIKPLFSPTIQVWQNNKNIPFIDARSPENNIRILYVGDYQDIQDNWYYRVANDSIGQVLLTSPRSEYRHIGHLYPNSFEPREDLNFAVCQFYAHNSNTITDANLYNRFYRKFFSILENGYMLTANFYLTPLDIEQLNLADRIWLNESWWHINKIIDYNPTKNTLTKVELITADTKLGDYTPNNNLFIERRWQQSEGFFGFYGDSYGQGKAMGKGNSIENSKNSLVIGDENLVQGKNNLVVGSGNKVSGRNTVVLGLDGRSIDGPGVYLGKTQQIVDQVDAGVDIVLNPVGDVIINLIDAGRDDVRPLGSYAIPSIIESRKTNN